MKTYYTDEKNVQILIALLKEHGIKKVVASPGTTNITFVRSMQNDSFFEMYSAIDERSAAYMACGLASESGEPVVLSCTGATASRNYMSGLTEAYYRKLPILAVTATQDISKVGHHIAQVIDRSIMPKDVVKHSVELSLIKDDSDWLNCELKTNNAILELSRHGGGPVHINLTTGYSRAFDTDKLPKVRKIKRFTHSSSFPVLPSGKISVLIGSHKILNDHQVRVLENFCESNNAVVFCDHTSGYKGKFAVLHSLSSSQRLNDFNDLAPELTIHIGEVTGDYSASKVIGNRVWRVSEDGEIRDTFGRLEYIFEISEEIFFEHYTNLDTKKTTYLNTWNDHLHELYTRIPDLPFSNVWIAKNSHKLIPNNSTIHFAILNSLRSWNFFVLPVSATSNSNVGGFGIDGCLSSLIGASLYSKERLYYAVIGDLSFFYDMNSIGNRNVQHNLRVLLINNGTGVEFRNFNHSAAQFGESADDFIAGGGHFGNKSRTLVKQYAESLGFRYLTASNKSEFEVASKIFFSNQMNNSPILFEVFTSAEDESNALEIITSISTNTRQQAKDTIKNALGDKNIRNLKKLLKRQ